MRRYAGELSAASTSACKPAALNELRIELQP